MTALSKRNSIRTSSIIWAVIATYLSSTAQLSVDTAAMLRAISGMPEFKIAYSLPSTIQYRLPFSINSLTVSYYDEKGKSLYVSETGNLEKGKYTARIDADTYIKYKTSTLWGNFHYENGRQRTVQWAETSDIKMIYPYITADAIGGDMQFEKYCFSGGYTDHNRYWNWGAGIAYDAGQYYRRVDPRPKNQTGLLRINAGGGRQIKGPYNLSIGIEYNRFSQSNDITFVSETGESKIYQLTGLGTHYIRFGGNGKSSHFKGDIANCKIAVTPGERKGIAGGAEYTYYKFSKILDDLNKLPIADANESSFSCEIGLKGIPELSKLYSKRGMDTYVATAYFSMLKRTGNENIFGDPASSIYPQTGKKEAYHATYMKYGLRGFWQRTYGTSTSLKAEAEVTDSRFHENHLDPTRFRTTRIFNLAVAVSGSLNIPAHINLRVKIFVSWSDPYRSINYIGKGDDKDDDRPTESFMMRTDIGALRQVCRGFHLTFLRPISSKLCLTLDGECSTLNYSDGNRLRSWNITTGVIF